MVQQTGGLVSAKFGACTVAGLNGTFFMYLKVHKIENFFGSEFEFYSISLLVMLKN